MKKGVITIYLAITFSVLLSLILGAIEAAKYSAYRVICESAFQCAVVSAFGEYNKELLKQYDLLYIDLSYMTNQVSYRALTDRVEKYMNENLGEPESRLLFAKDFFGTGTATVSLTDAQMASDIFGSDLRKQAVEYTKDEIGVDFANDFLSLIRIKKEYDLDGESFKRRKEELDNAAQEAVSDADETVNDMDSWVAGQEEIVAGKESEEVKTIKSSLHQDLEMTYIRPFTAFVLGDNVWDVSGKHFNFLDAPSFRLSSNLGNSKDEYGEVENDPLADVYFTEYIVRKTGNYIHRKENSYLQYEAEYIYGGRNNDSENLGLVVESIYFIRCAANFISLERDKEKKEIVDEIAKGISALVKVPAPVVSALIMCMWAAGESTYDMDELYKGDRVELIKDADKFHLSIQGGLQNLLADLSFSGTGKNKPALPGGNQTALAEDTELGTYSANSKTPGISIRLSYTDYLRILIYLMPSPVKSLRMMDIIEMDILNTGGNENFRIDWCLDGAIFEAVVESSFGAKYVINRRYGY